MLFQDALHFTDVSVVHVVCSAWLVKLFLCSVHCTINMNPNMSRRSPQRFQLLGGAQVMNVVTEIVSKEPFLFVNGVAVQPFTYRRDIVAI
jgi:hypothetical protein